MKAARSTIRKSRRSSRSAATAAPPKRDIETQEKKGIDTGLVAIHPVTGEKMPVWVANFVLMDYGTGAVMAVPGARSARLGIRDEVRSADQDGDRQRRGARCDRASSVAMRREPDPMTSALGRSRPLDVSKRRARWHRRGIRARHHQKGAYTDYGWLVNSGEFDGLDYRGAFDAIAKRFEATARARAA